MFQSSGPVPNIRLFTTNYTYTVTLVSTGLGRDHEPPVATLLTNLSCSLASAFIDTITGFMYVPLLQDEKLFEINLDFR